MGFFGPKPDNHKAIGEQSEAIMNWCKWPRWGSNPRPHAWSKKPNSRRRSTLPSRTGRATFTASGSPVATLCEQISSTCAPSPCTRHYPDRL